MNKTVLVFALLLFLFPSCNKSGIESNIFKDKYDLDKRIQSFNDIHLEMSLKPFKVNNRDSIDQVCRNVFHTMGSVIKTRGYNISHVVDSGWI